MPFPAHSSARVRASCFLFFSLTQSVALSLGHCVPRVLRWMWKQKEYRECKSITHANLSAFLIWWCSWAAGWTWIRTFSCTKHFQKQIRTKQEEKQDEEKHREKKNKREKYGFVWYFCFGKLYLRRTLYASQSLPKIRDSFLRFLN